jgi:sterol desaturase/sphingolipid hydroxylase (fatty acid hydroxylase superfamily)
VVENFTTLYAIVFYVTVIVLAGCELLPLNRQTVHLARRWPTNTGLFALNFVVMWICVPISALEVAQHAGSGPLILTVEASIGIVLGVLVLDLWKYCEHRMMHRFSPLWRFHLVHHSDTDVDFTTTERHHPIEVAFSTVILLAVVYMLTIPPLAVAILARCDSGSSQEAVTVPG